jgi:general secretion pathway protein F
MSSADLARTETARLEEFVALNDELAALARGGLPLELGLSAGGSRRLAGRIAEKIRNGQSLDDALAAEGDSLPRAYRAVVEAGIRSGRLSDAVEVVSRATRAMIRLQRRLAIAAIYPSILIVAAFTLAVTVLPKLLEIILAIFAERGNVPPVGMELVLRLIRENPTGWLIWLPLACIVLLWLTGGLAGVTLRLPGMNSLLRPYRIAAFAELAAGLLEHRVPLDEALVLAADGSGDRALARNAQAAAERLRSGVAASAALAEFESLPRFGRWMLAAGASQGTIPTTLRHIAEWANARGASRLDWYSFVAPAVVTVVVGGTVVALFAAASFGPVIALINKLAVEASL